MRIILAGERGWNADELAKSILTRLLARYGPDIVVIHGGANGIDRSISLACKELGVMDELYLPEFSRAGDYAFQNRELLRRGAGLCLILHRSALDAGCSDLTRQAIAARVPTYLIDSEHGKPVRLTVGDEQLR
jgi:YspA, cpYpsA-related SLOG family